MIMITHDTPTSSNIARIHYDDDRGLLTIEFRSGKTYRYHNVPYDTWNFLVEAPSVGRAFNQEVKGKFKEEQV